MFLGEGEDAFSVLDRFLDARVTVSREQLRELGYGRRLVGLAVKYGVIRVLVPGLFVDARREVDERWVYLAAKLPDGVVTLESASALHGLVPAWSGPVQVVLPRGRHLPRIVPRGVQFVTRRGEWSDEDLVCVSSPGTGGVSVRCFSPLRTFGELAAEGHLESARRAGRELLSRGERAHTLLEVMLRLRTSRRQASDTLFELFAPDEGNELTSARTPPRWGPRPRPRR